jgi:hypothetical protein
MKEHPATWLLAILVALGAGQAVPLSSLRRSPETCALVQVVRARREQLVRRERATPGYTDQDPWIPYSHDLLTAICLFWNARLLRAPPLSFVA